MGNDFLSQEEIDMLLKGAGSAEEDDQFAVEEKRSSDKGSKEQVSEYTEKMELERILDFPLRLSISLGEARKTMGEVTSLNAGAVVDLSHPLEEPVNVMANGKVIARGEVVVIEENFGIEITEILPPKGRLQELRANQNS